MKHGHVFHQDHPYVWAYVFVFMLRCSGCLSGGTEWVLVCCYEVSRWSRVKSALCSWVSVIFWSLDLARVPPSMQITSLLFYQGQKLIKLFIKLMARQKFIFIPQTQQDEERSFNFTQEQQLSVALRARVKAQSSHPGRFLNVSALHWVVCRGNGPFHSSQLATGIKLLCAALQAFQKSSNFCP